MPELTVKTLGEIRNLEPLEWDRCAGTENPFLSHAFLSSLEESQCACRATGWLPQHLGLYWGDEVVGVVPLYVKSHSVGEFVFDYSWANAYQRAGGAYYPKLLIGVPFTPVPGARILLRPDVAGPEMEKIVIQALRSLTDQMGLSSLHLNFCPQATYSLAGVEWLQRTGLQFHWFNRGYHTFQDFLDSLSARKRKDIRKERQAVASSGLELLTLSGDDLKEEHWDAFFAFYIDTCDRKWGEAALNRKFFTLLNERLAHRVVLMLARDQGRYVAGALNLLGDNTLFGRNWGALGHYPFLHFELCYYRAIEYAIDRGLAKVEAGAQGMHKVARGYEPVETYSLHYIRDVGFRRLLNQVLEQERAVISENLEEIAHHTPFRKGLQAEE